MIRFLLLFALAALIAAPFAVASLTRGLPGAFTDRWRARFFGLRLAARVLPRHLAAQLRFRWALFRVTGDLGALYFRRGKSNAWFLPTVAGAAGPTLAEITAGTELGAAIAGMQGWETSLNRIQQAVLKYATDYQVDGPQQFGDAQMTFLDDDGVGSDTDSTARQAVSTVMVEQGTGFVCLSPKVLAPIAATKVHLFPVKIGARNDTFSLDNEPARYVCDFAITGAARKNVAVLA